jgi:hypothetical protein
MKSSSYQQNKRKREYEFAVSNYQKRESAGQSCRAEKLHGGGVAHGLRLCGNDRVKKYVKNEYLLLFN